MKLAELARLAQGCTVVISYTEVAPYQNEYIDASEEIIRPDQQQIQKDYGNEDQPGNDRDGTRTKLNTFPAPLHSNSWVSLKVTSRTRATLAVLQKL
jgi:hypothetical protein